MFVIVPCVHAFAVEDEALSIGVVEVDTLVLVVFAAFAAFAAGAAVAHDVAASFLLLK